MSAKPLHATRIGNRALPNGVEVPEAGARGLGFASVPVQREMWRLLEAERRGVPSQENAAVEVPRRAGKTEGLFSAAVGRCEAREDYQVTYCAQSGTKSRERFYGLLRRYRRFGQDGAVAWRPRESRGEERIEWENGSTLRFLPPLAASFRGDAVDWLILDEAQEVDAADAAELLGSVLPVFDTRAGAQLTVAGTAGAMREGLLWDALVKGRAGSWGILEYAAPDGMDLDDEANWLRVHPGPAGVPRARALAVLRKRHAEMSPTMFAREYLGVWPDVTTASAFAPAVWDGAGDLRAAMPSRFGLAFDVTPSGDRAAVTATWRDAEGVLRFEVVRDDPGTGWVAEFVAGLASKYRLPAGYDTSGVETLGVAEEIARRFPRVQLRGLTTIEFATACAALAAAVLGGTARHARQPALDEAVRNASRRAIRDGGWAWGRKVSTGSIAPLVAATVGVGIFDSLPAKRIGKVLVAS